MATDDTREVASAARSASDADVAGALRPARGWRTRASATRGSRCRQCAAFSRKLATVTVAFASSRLHRRGCQRSRCGFGAVADSRVRGGSWRRAPSCRSLPRASPKADARQRDAEGEHRRRERQRAWRPVTPARPGKASPRARREAPAPSGERVTAHVPERDRNPAHWRYTGDVGSARRSAANCRLRPSRLHRGRGGRSRDSSCRSLPSASPKADARQRDAEGEHRRRERQRAWRPVTPAKARCGKSASAARSASDADVAAAPRLAGRAADARARCRRRARDTRTQ